MKRKNATRSALVTSIISLLLCVSMLVGTTFAWFTDSVESGVNVINAGNLDVELYHGKDADPNEKVDNSDKLFTDFNGNLIELWEPGVVAYTNLKVANVGTLALTYQMAINFTNMNYVENDGMRYTLADVLKVAVVEGGFTGDRAAAHALDYNYTLASFGLEGVLEADETTKTYGVVIYWEPNDNTYDNLFNLNNGKTSSDNNPLHVDLGISLFATQEMYEEDSFDDTYDEDAKLEMPDIRVETPTLDAFLAALKAGETAVLTYDLALDDGDFVIPAGTTSAIDLNDHTLTVGANGGIEVEGNLIVTGTGNINVTSGEDGTYAGFLVDEGATMEIGEGVTINTPSNAIGVWVLGDLIVDGATINAAAGSHGIFTHESGETDITINSGSVNGDGDAIYIGWNVNADIVIGEDAQVGKIVGGYGGTTANITYYGDPTLDIAEDAAETINLYNIRNVETDEELADAINDCANEIILAEGEFTADLYNIAARDSMIITGQGADTKLAFSNLQVRASQFKNLTIENCTIERMPDKAWGHLVFGSSNNADGVYTISNCIFNGVGSQGIFINENISGATYNIENCVFNGDFGGEGAITIQNNDAVFAVNVNGCEFNNIPESSHEIFVAPYKKGSWTLNVDGRVTVATVEQLAAVVANGATDIYLLDGEYNVANCGGKTLTLNGSKNAVLRVMNEGEDGCDYGFGSGGTGVGNITFNGLTIDTTANTGSYKGYAYMKGTFNDCDFVGAYSLNNANDFVFNRCSFDFRNGYFWTWGANSVTFNGCTFGGNSKNILAHGYASTKININNCAFEATEKGYASGGTVWTSAVEIDPAGSNTYTININNSTINENYSGWTRIKDGSTGHYINVNGVVETPIIGNSQGTVYEGELFEEGSLTDALVAQNQALIGDATITVKRTYQTVALENVTANVNGNLITAEADNTIILHDCDITLPEGAKLVVTTEGVTVGQVMIHNVTVNGELLTQATAAQYLQGVNWYEVW